MASLGRALSSLKDLQLTVISRGDPSPLSALTDLTSLHISSKEIDDDALATRFSSLQPLSTMQQLAKLNLVFAACSATTSLRGLAGLSNLRSVSIQHAAESVSLEGLPGGVEHLFLIGFKALDNMAGLESLSSLRSFRIDWCGDPSLQRLSGLGSLTRLEIWERSERITSRH